MTATTGCFAWKVTSNKWPLLFSFQSYDSNEYERGSFVHTGCYLHLNTARVWIACEGFSSAEKRRRGCFRCFNKHCCTSADFINNPFLKQWYQTTRSHIKGNISSFCICMCAYINICMPVCMYTCFLGGLQALRETSWMADRSIQTSAGLWPLVMQSTVSLVVWTKQGFFNGRESLLADGIYAWTSGTKWF